MAEETTTTNDGHNEAAAVAQQDPTQEEGNSKTERTTESYQKELEKLRKENAKYRTERNEYRADAEKFREMQDAEETELQRAQEALEAERNKATQFQVELARSKSTVKVRNLGGQGRSACLGPAEVRRQRETSWGATGVGCKACSTSVKLPGGGFEARCFLEGRCHGLFVS